METEVDILEFRVPVENKKTLFVWDIQPCHCQAFIHVSLFGVFSSFGPLYLLKVMPNCPPAPPGFYAVVKFYSAAQASKAQQQTDRRTLFQTTPVKVRVCTKQTPSHLLDPYNSKLLSHARCVELANHCLGFNGWSTRIITLKELSAAGPEEEEEERRRERKLRYGCMLLLSFPQHGASSTGVSVEEDTFTDTGPEVCLQYHCKLQRLVREKALVQAFSTVLLILLGNGKVMVEVRQDRDQLPLESTEGNVQVTTVSWSEFAEEINEGEWDLSVS